MSGEMGMVKQQQHVYTINVVSGVGREFRCRDWGYFFEEATAREVIVNNLTDISEIDYYHYGILSRKGEGPLAIGETIQWYEFIWEGDKFVRANEIERPEQYKHIGF